MRVPVPGCVTAVVAGLQHPQGREAAGFPGSVRGARAERDPVNTRRSSWSSLSAGPQ